MPTRNTLFVFFLLLVFVPVGAAAYLGAAGLERERGILVARERDAMERRADEVRDALVRQLQELHRVESERSYVDYFSLDDPRLSENPLRDRFQVVPGGAVAWQGREAVPGDIASFAKSGAVTSWLAGSELREISRSDVAVTDFEQAGDLAFRRVTLHGVRYVQGFRLDYKRLNRWYLDPASPSAVVPRFDVHLDRAQLVRDDPRDRIETTDALGLPQVVYRHVVPAKRTGRALIPVTGFVLEVSVHPSAALERDLEAAGSRLWWTLVIVGAVIALGLLFFWRALRAEARLAERRADFVNAVSHELRTPLTSIRMYADMLKEGWVTDPDAAREYVGLLSAESERLARLVHNVLDFASIEKGGRSFEMQVGDPAPVVRDVAEVLRPYLKSKGFELVLEMPGSLPACSFDRDALTQILVNLIDNAVKYGAKEVRIEAEAQGGEVQFRVLDRGPGVPADERERIFAPFERGRRAAAGGSGLGLALVRHYVAAHKGAVDITDREGGGAIFRITLPAV